MTITSYPFETQDTTETQYQRIMGLYRVPGVVGAPGSTAMAATAPGGMVVRFAAGLVHCRGMVLDNDGAPTDNQRDVTVLAADTQARVDRIVARFDPANDSAYLHHLKGTAGSTTPPLLTRTASGVYDVKLVRVDVAGGAAGLGGGTITDERDWVDVGVERWTTADRPSPAGMYQLGQNLTTGRLEFWDGSGWRYVMDQRDTAPPAPGALWTGGGFYSTGYGTLTGYGAPQYVLGTDGFVDLLGGMLRTAATTGPLTIVPLGTVPAGVIPDRARAGGVVSTQVGPAGLEVSAAGVLSLRYPSPVTLVQNTWWVLFDGARFRRLEA